jgi:hypothetical protein
MFTSLLPLILVTSVSGSYRGITNLHSVDPDPSVRKRLDPVLAEARSISIDLVLRKDGTYQLKRGKGSVFAPETVEGQWALLKPNLILMPRKVNGKVTRRPSQTLAPKKSDWVMKLDPAGDIRGEIIFARV